MKFFTRLNLDLSRVFFSSSSSSSYPQMSAKIRRYNFIKVLGEGQVTRETCAKGRQSLTHLVRCGVQSEGHANERRCGGEED